MVRKSRESYKFNKAIADDLVGYNVHIYVKGSSTIIEIPHALSTIPALDVKRLIALTEGV